MSGGVLAGKTCLVTGATSGIGYHTALGLARMGASVIGVGRSGERCRAARESILAQCRTADLAFQTVDLASQNAIRDLGARLRSRLPALDVLVNNAGAFTMRRKLSPEGHELQLAVNFLAPFRLTHELMPLLQVPADARVVTLSSGQHFGARPNWIDLGLGGPYFALRAYGHSKLACVLFMYELARRLGTGSTVTTYAVDPGLVNTDMGLKDVGPLARLVWLLRKRGGATPEQGAQTTLFVSSDPAAPLDTGRYWKSCTPVPSSPVSHDPAVARRLWSIAEGLCGIPEGTYGKPAS